MSGLQRLHQADTDKAWDAIQSLPAPAAPLTQSKWNAWSLPLRGALVGGIERAASFSDELYGAAQVYAATPMNGPDPFPEQTEAARQRMITKGIDTNSEVGRSLRNVARDYRPDPETAGLAEKVFFEIPRGLTKALGHAFTGGGPIVGSVTYGVDEGMTTASELADQGVDLETRAKVGATVGAISAAGGVLPLTPAVAGGITLKTVAQTAGLMAIGGPGSFMAQQATVRDILANANYVELSKQYDPLDPVGLALSTLLPLGFGAVGLRAATKGVVSKARTPNPARVSNEQIDAVMTHNLSIAQDIRDATPPAEAIRIMNEGFVGVDLTPPQAALARRADPLPHRDVPESFQFSADPELADLQRRALQLDAGMADVPVRLTDDGQHVTAKEEIARIRREVAEGTDDDVGMSEVNLARVAAECALALGVR